MVLLPDAFAGPSMAIVDGLTLGSCGGLAFACAQGSSSCRPKAGAFRKPLREGFLRLSPSLPHGPTSDS